jgi:hypothetical protein
MAQTPDRSFNNSDRLGRFILANEPAIISEKFTVPLMFEGAPFQAGAVDASDFFTWAAPGVSPDTRNKFARNTCNGCHTFSESGGSQFQIAPRFPGQESQLSGFLLGADVEDDAAGVIRHFNELARRGRILHDLVCPGEMLPPPPPDTTPIPTGAGGTGGGPPPPRDGGIIITGGGGAVGSSDGGIPIPTPTGFGGAPGK